MKNLQKNSTPGKYHHGDLRRAIVEAAVVMIEEAGLEKLSLREIARTLGVTTAAPYHHFKDRHALMVALAQDGYDELLSALRAAQAEAEAPQTELDAAVVAYLRFALSRRALYEVIMSSDLIEDHRHGVLKAPSEMTMEVARRSVAMLCDLPLKESLEATFCIWAMLSGISRLAIGGILRESPAEQERLAMLGVRGIAAGFATRAAALVP
jgi:AcrR family transcriptional regulator